MDTATPVMLTTQRLLLRPWRDSDLAPFAELNADPQVMEHFPALMSQADSDDLGNRIRDGIIKNGWGLWAVEVADTGEFAGFTGLSRPGFDAHFTPAVEVGWRLARHHWGFGYATEAAIAAVDFAFETLELPEIVSFTATENLRSRAVMERLSMTHDPADDFNHPKLSGNRVERHVLYRLTSTQWRDR